MKVPASSFASSTPREASPFAKSRVLAAIAKLSAELLPKADRQVLLDEWLTELDYIQQVSYQDAVRFALFLPVAALKIRLTELATP